MDERAWMVCVLVVWGLAGLPAIHARGLSIPNVAHAHPPDTITDSEQEDAVKIESEMTGLRMEDLETLGELFGQSDYPAYGVF
jgi:hypothetical protein